MPISVTIHIFVWGSFKKGRVKQYKYYTRADVFYLVTLSPTLSVFCTPADCFPSNCTSLTSQH